ncbi:MAG: glycosyltransferase family 2 protein [Gemmatimonadota bacterium]|nr:glycosyltransferase family 2 protein [Gemmatimonadota bacterium]
MTQNISVVITCFKQAEFILSMLPTLLAELHADDEVIVADDGSGDGSPERIAQAFAADARVSVLRSQPTRSVSRTRNRGLEVATGRWVAFLDGDDEFLPGWRDRFAAGFAAFSDVDVFFCDYTQWHVGRAHDAPPRSALEVRGIPVLLNALTVHQVGAWRELDSEKFNDLLLRLWVPFHTANTAYRRQWLSANDLRYDPRFPVSEDTDLQLRAAQGARIAFVPEILARYRVSPDGLAARDDTPALLSRHLQRYSMLQLPAARRGSAAEGGVWRRIALSERHLAESLLLDGFPGSALRHALRSFMAHPQRRTLRIVGSAVLQSVAGRRRRRS